jgi:sulfur-carrier protein
VATVYIPTLIRKLTGGRDSFELEGANVKEILDRLNDLYPGVRDRLMEGNRLRSHLSVAIDGEVRPMGLLEPVGPASEIHFIASLKGG